jgi:hypothetical protein
LISWFALQHKGPHDARRAAVLVRCDPDPLGFGLVVEQDQAGLATHILGGGRVAVTTELIDRLVEATKEAKVTIRELHEARKDARTAIADLDAKVATIRDEVIEANNELAKREWRRAMDSIHLSDLGAGLKSTFSQWTDLLAEATSVLSDLHAKDERLAESLLRIEARVRRLG